MTIEIKEGRFFIAQWFVDRRPVPEDMFSDHGGDYLAMAYTDDPAGKDARDWIVQYRFRYNHPSGNTEQDEKVWYEIRARDTPMSHVEEVLDEMAGQLRLTTPGWQEVEKTPLYSADPDHIGNTLLNLKTSHVTSIEGNVAAPEGVN